MNNIRKQRVESAIKREISTMILTDIKDPRVGFVSVTHVSLTNDIRIAHVYVSVMGDEETKEKSLEGLKSAAGFIRKQVGDVIKLRYTPEIIFKIDDTQEERNKILRILKTLESEKQ
jgi:ribosome-binding factor A